MRERSKLRDVARGRWREILLALGVAEDSLGKRHGPCPICGGCDRFRFDDLEGRGTSICNRCGGRDGVQLAMEVTGGSFRELADDVERICSDFTEREPEVPHPPRNPLEAVRAVRERSRPIRAGDPAWRYLRTRGLTLDQLPEGLRFHPSLLYAGDNTTLPRTFPAMIGELSGPSGELVSLHRTYLHGAAKAPVASPKRLMAGLAIAGAAIRLAPANGGLVGIAEGIETAMAATEMFKVPVWSCVSAHGLSAFEPPPEVKAITIFGDNDTNYCGQGAAYVAAERLTRRGFQVDVRVPSSSGDWLDELQRGRNCSNVMES